MFPNPDPIPLPAPVWLMKLLSLVTLGLHFSAVMILVGSLILVLWLNIKGRSSKVSELVSASYTLAKRLPVIMTYVINLGVPPLLFVQVLYGQQIYSSSVIIAVPWVSVIFLVMAAYWLLYGTVSNIEKNKPVWHLAGLALLIVLGIGQIYSMNMTLMLHPELWNDMYAKSANGMQGFSQDPTTTSRWLFVMAGGPLFGGLWAALLSNMVYLSENVRHVLRKSGGRLALVGALGMVFFGYRILSAQPEAVMQGIDGSMLHKISLLAAIATIALAGVLGALQGFASKSNTLVGTLGVLVAFLAATTSGIVRDGIRDFTLKAHGFDVYASPVYANWSVLIAFLLLFVIMLGIIFWLLMVMRRATAPKEEIAL